ncbi:MAG TPA: carboxypeptidase regulatory-like domain-containing protein, partial [Gemmatimonadaceae bacterium]|nr:carboxypeptidase regulatory-like domain-containing protein [Gemmatimonadaceae bacterium]
MPHLDKVPNFVPFAHTAARAALLFAIPIALSAQAPATGTIAGRVTSRVDSAAVAGAAVSVGSRQTLTDATGRFVLSAVPAGGSIVRVRRLGYRTLEREVVVVPNDTVRLDLALEAEAQPLAPVRTDVARTEVESFTARP